MDFLGVGLPELLIILLVALLVVGPKRLPDAGIQIARAIRSLRHYATEVTSELRAELEEASKEVEELRGLRQALNEDISPVAREIEEGLQEDLQIDSSQSITETKGTLISEETSVRPADNS